MLEHMVRTEHRRLTQLAASWLKRGAQSFGIYIDVAPVAAWSAPGVAAMDSVSVPLRYRAERVADLRVTGLAAADVLPRLAEDALLLERLMQLEDELDQMTGELITTQDQLLALYDLGRSTRSHLGLRDTLRTLAREAARILKARGAALYMPPLLVTGGDVLTDDAALLAIIKQTLLGKREVVQQRGDPYNIPGTANVCAVPITVRGQITAALVVMDKPGGAFHAPDIKLMQAIGEHAGAQLEHALLHEDLLERARLRTEVELARSVQSQLLPQQLPAIAGVESFARALAANQVGGDFYDVITPPGKLPFFIIGDVAGKGMSAALVMAMLHTTAGSTVRFMPNVTPAAVIGRANTNLYDNLTTLQRFVTAFVAQCDLQAGVIHYANAGHAPVIYCPAGGPARLLEADSPPIGVLPELGCANWSVRFTPGDVLVLATDGLSEAMSVCGEQFGIERLLALVTAHAAGSAATLGTTLLAAVAQHALGRPQDDDQTILVIKCGSTAWQPY